MEKPPTNTAGGCALFFISQCAYKLFHAIHSFFELLIAVAVGDADEAFRAEGDAGNRGDLAFLDHAHAEGRGIDAEFADIREYVEGTAALADDLYEMKLCQSAIKNNVCVLGICRGCQLINVYFGGSLYQHLQRADLHVSVNGADSVHKITATEGSVLNDLYGEAFAVNSSHHQAVKDLGEGLRATAFWNGEYIEAHEHKTLPIFSVQFHPERMCFAKARTDTVNGSDIFKHFIAVCEKYAEK